MSVSELKTCSRVEFPPADMLREANHRISNHLTLLVGMVRTQAGAVARGPQMLSREYVQGLLLETAGKVISVGHLHRRLAEMPERGVINLGDYLIETCHTLVSSLSLGKRVSLVQRLAANCNVTPEQAQQAGLMVCEVIMNAAKHAHPTGIPVQISLACRRDDDGRMTIEIGDDGVGLPEGSDAATMDGVGLKLIRSLTRALNAELRVESDSLGLTFLITLPPEVQSMAVAAS